MTNGKTIENRAAKWTTYVRLVHRQREKKRRRKKRGKLAPQEAHSKEAEGGGAPLIIVRKLGGGGLTLVSVDFPPPDGPTRAKVSPGATDSETESMTLSSGRVGYEKPTCSGREGKRRVDDPDTGCGLTSLSDTTGLRRSNHRSFSLRVILERQTASNTKRAIFGNLFAVFDVGERGRVATYEIQGGGGVQHH